MEFLLELPMRGHALPPSARFACPCQELRGREISSDVVPETTDPVADASPPRPFVERRRSRPIEHSWPEALDALHRLL